MFKSKPKQQKKPSKSNARTLNSVDKYYQKIKSKHFQVYLNSGVNQYEIADESYTHTGSIMIDNYDELLENVVKNFSSLYQIDHKSFEWKDKIQQFIKAGKEIMNVINKFKHQINKFYENRLKVQQLQQINNQLSQQNQQLQRKCESITSIENKEHGQVPNQQFRDIIIVKSISKQQQKGLFEQYTDQTLKLSEENESLKRQIMQLNQKIDKLECENKNINIYLKNIRDSCFDQNQIKEISRHVVFDNQQLLANLHNAKKPLSESKVSFEKNILHDPKLSSHLISYLSPKTITILFSLSKSSRFFLFHSPLIIYSTFRAIVGYKNFEIAFLRRHINHFQKLLKKIPEEIIQSTFYQYNILKQQVGGDFLSILNLCGNIFEGKISPGTSQSNNKVIKEYVEGKEIMHHIQLPKHQELYLQVDHDLINQFFQQRKLKKQSIMKQIESMTTKICMNESLYSVDQATLKEFYQTVIKHFSFLFVFAKYLFSQARNLQYLNHFLLAQLNEIDKFKIEKEYDLEDIKAQLETSARINQFLGDKCNKSEERILRQTKDQLEMQKLIAKLSSNIKEHQSSISRLENEIKLKQVQYIKINQNSNQIKVMYNASREKYNRLINQLNILKETILKIN